MAFKEYLALSKVPELESNYQMQLDVIPKKQNFRGSLLSRQII